MVVRSADVTISMYWDHRWKKWGLTGRVGNVTRTVTARSTTEIGETEMTLLMHAMVREIEALLPLQE